MILPGIPRLYTALAESLAVMLYARNYPQRFNMRTTVGASVLLVCLLGAFLHMTGDVPLVWWVPCMVIAVGMQFLYLWGTREANWLETAYDCARSFILAEFSASAEWQLHCVLFPQKPGYAPAALLVLVLVYGAVFGFIFWFDSSRPTPSNHLEITNSAALVAVLMAVTVFAVSNLSFLNGEETMSVFYIRTLVDFSGVMILTLQHEQLRETALHAELAAMDSVLHRQYEQYKRSKESIRIINSRYHELKIQIADIRAERDRAKQDAALAQMESSILQYEAENKTGNPVLDTLLTAKNMECQEKKIRMTNVADGSSLNFLTTREICILVGTALDNAIESCAKEPDPDKRLIRTAVYLQNGFAMIRVENYCAQPVYLGPDGLPTRSRHGGYDLRSLQATAQRHGGSMTVHWENEWFTLRVLLPVPEKET